METVQRNILLLVLSRASILLVVAFLTLVLGRGSQYVWPVILLTTIALPLTIVYAVALRLRIPGSVMAPIQFANDILLVSWLVYRTGDVESPFNALYLIIIFAASLLSIGRAIGVTIATLMCAVAMGIGTISGAVPRSDGTVYATTALPDLQLNLSYTVVAILCVAVLATYLADRQRRSDTALAATTRSLADLRAFNERIIESMRSGLLTAGLDGRVTTCNRAAQDILGLPDTEILDRPLVELFGDVAGARFRADDLPTNTTIVRSDVSFSKPNGTVAHLGFNVTPLLSEQDEVTGVVLIFQDLTEVFELEQEVRRREKLAALGTMAAGLAHEIRNPLASMRGSVQVLASDLAVDDGSRRLTDIILRESERLNRTVTDFLTFARPAPHAPSEFDLRRVIAEAVILLRNSPEVDAEHSIVEHYPERPCPFWGDANQVRQIFWNLARNGLQAMPSGGRLSVGIEADGDGYRLAVADEGIGMSPDQIERIFEPFSSQKEGGIGLGMAIVYAFTRDHSGRIAVESEVGAGTQVVVTLPRLAQSFVSGAERADAHRDRAGEAVAAQGPGAAED
jgi:two-component system sensor histidine kinase PilS (NtrC family)